MNDIKSLEGFPSGLFVNNELLNDLYKDREIASHAKRLALELECLLLDCKDSVWWKSGHEALDNYQKAVDTLYPQDHVSPLGKD